MDIVDRIQMLVNEKGLTIAALERNTGLSNGIIKKWKKQSPSCDKIVVIANYLNVSIEYLILGSTYTEHLSCDAEKLLKYYNQLSILEKGMVLGKAETLAELAAERAAQEAEKVSKEKKKVTEKSKPITIAPAADEASEQDEERLIEIRHSVYKVSAGCGFELDEGDNWETIEISDTPEARRADYALTISGDSMEPVYYDGDIVLVKMQDTVEIGQIGIFILDGSGYIKKYCGDHLVSLNEDYDDIPLSDYEDVRCSGRVIGRV